MRLVDLRVAEEGFDKVLAVVEDTVHSKAVHVRIRDGGHLQLLDLRRPALRVEDKDGDVLLAPEAMNGR